MAFWVGPLEIGHLDFAAWVPDPDSLVKYANPGTAPSLDAWRSPKSGSRGLGFGVEAEQKSEGWPASGQSAPVGLLAATVLSCARTSSFVLWVRVCDRFQDYQLLLATAILCLCFNVATVLFL